MTPTETKKRKKLLERRAQLRASASKVRTTLDRFISASIAVTDLMGVMSFESIKNPGTPWKSAYERLVATRNALFAATKAQRRLYKTKRKKRKARTRTNIDIAVQKNWRSIIGGGK